MVDTALAPHPGAATPRRRPLWRTLWVIAPVLFVVMLGIARIVYWRTSIAYAPLRLQGLGAPALGHPISVRTASNGLLMTGPVGSDQVFEFPILNDGIHPIEINRVTVQDEAVAGVQWAANFVQNGRRIPSPSHDLPVHVPGHAIVNLQLIVRRPACPAKFPLYLNGRVTLHWHAMISPHATSLNLLGSDPTYVALCPGR
jgi:hypothetical protein